MNTARHHHSLTNQPLTSEAPSLQTTAMRTDYESPPPKKIRLRLQQNEEYVAAVILQTTTRITRITTINQLADEVIGISLGLLGGVGHFRYGPLACKMFLKASEVNKDFKKITTGESVTSSISCAKKYFEDKGTGKEILTFFWENAARYGRVEVMDWAHQQGYSTVWNPYVGESIGSKTCAKAAEYGQLDTLEWLKQNGCPWDIVILVLLLLEVVISLASNG